MKTPATEPAGKTSGFWDLAKSQIRLINASPEVKPQPRTGAIPASFNQERLWRVEEVVPGYSVQNLLHEFRIQGPLEVGALRQALSALVERHESLRTSFHSTAEGLVQTIHPAFEIDLPLTDLSGKPAAEQAAALAAARDEAAKLFDLTALPLFRFHLLQLAPESFVLYRTIHHIIFDGLSHAGFLRELSALFSAFKEGKPSPLLPVPVQCADHALTQRAWYTGENLQAATDFWSQKLDASVRSLELPADFGREKALGYEGAFTSLELPEDLVAGAKKLAQDNGVSLYVTLLACFNLLLLRSTGQTDQLVCSPVAGRNRPEIRNLIGYFNNLIVMRSRLADDPAFPALLAQLSQTFVELTPWQDLPLQFVASLPTMARASLSRCMFVLQNNMDIKTVMAGLSVETEYCQRPVANFDLALAAYESPKALKLVLHYKTALFKAETAQALLARFAEVVERIVAQPALRPSQLPDWRPKKRPETRQESAADLVLPRDQVEFKLCQLWAEELGLPEVGINQSLYSLGADSLATLRLTRRIVQDLQVELPLEALFLHPTVEALASLLRDSSGATAQGSSLIPLRSAGTQPPLFLCEGVGIYYPLTQVLGDDQPVYGLIAGTENGQPWEYDSLAELAALYIREIKAVQPKGPYRLGGISWGGVAAYEMAQQLRAAGEEVSLVAFFDTVRPGALRPYGLLRKLAFFGRLLLRKGPRHVVDRLRKAEAAPEVGLAPVPQAGVHASMRGLFQEACRRYTFKPYPGRVVIYSATDRDAWHCDPWLGWGGLLLGPLEIKPIRGGHLDVIRQPAVQVLGRHLADQLNKNPETVP